MNLEASHKTPPFCCMCGVNNSVCQAENPQTIQEVNECIMVILRHMCEDRQRDHVHLSDSSRTGGARNEVRAKSRRIEVGKCVGKGSKAIFICSRNQIGMLYCMDMRKERGRTGKCGI